MTETPPPKPPRPLTSEDVFRLVCEEAFRDGVLQDWENRLLQGLVRFFKLDKARAKALAAGAQLRFKRGELGKSRPLSPRHLYRKVLYYSAEDGRMTPGEVGTLKMLQRLFQIDAATDRDVRRQVLDHFRRRGDRPPPPPAPSAVPPDPTDPARALRNAADALATAASQGELTAAQEAVLDGFVPRLVDAAADGYEPDHLYTLADLAPLLATRRRSKPVWAILVDSFERDAPWPEAPGQLTRVFRGLAYGAASRRDPDELRGFVATAEAAVYRAGGGAAAWTAWSYGVFEVLKALASYHHWELHVELLRAFDRVPEARVPAVAGAWAEAGADWLVLGLHAGQHYAIDRGLHELKRMASFRDQPAVRHAEAAALSCLVETFAGPGVPEPRYFLEGLRRLRELVAGYPGDAELVEHASRVASEACVGLLWLREPGGAAELLEQLARFVSRTEVTPDAAADIAKAAVRAALAHRRSGAATDAADPLLVAARRVFAALSSRHGDLPIVAGAKRRLDQVLRGAPAISGPPGGRRAD